MGTNYKCMFDKQEFVLVCREKIYENKNISDELFLVFKDEWEYNDSNSNQTFDLLLTLVENNIVRLYPAPDDAVIIVQQVPYSKKSDYKEIL